MALAATTVWEVETGGSDTLNGGAFDPGQTAGMFTDGAATSANTNSPVFTSASYNFVAGDVGAWVYIASGTNWTPGWYKIASVAANAATLTGTIGLAVLKAGVPSTVVGCATVASPTTATWTIDYSQQAAAQFTYTDLASVGTGLTVSSAAKPFAKQMVGNSIVITGGTNFNTGRYVIASVAAVTFIATVVGPTNVTTGAGVSGTGGLGGALLSIGLVASLKTALSGNNSNTVWIQTGAYTITSASTNIAGGCVADNTGAGDARWEGYGTIRGDMGTAPVFTASGISSFTMFLNSPTNGFAVVRNLTFDGASLTTSKGVSCNNTQLIQVTAKNFTNVGITGGSTQVAYRCVVTGCSTQSAFQGGHRIECVAYNNTVTGFSGNGVGSSVRCLAYGNSGASSDGFAVNTNGATVNCVSYNNGRHGFNVTGGDAILWGCLAESNASYGYSGRTTLPCTWLYNCGAYLNTLGATDSVVATQTFNTSGFITGTGSFFTNAAGGNFSLNNTAGAGAAARGLTVLFPVGLTTGYPDAGAAQHADPASSVGFFIQ